MAWGCLPHLFKESSLYCFYWDSDDIRQIFPDQISGKPRELPDRIPDRAKFALIPGLPSFEKDPEHR